MGGIVPKVIFGYWEDVATWPTIPETTAGSTGISFDDAGVLADDLVMADGTCAYTLEFNDEVGSFQIAPQGDKGNISFLYTLTFINKRIRDKVLGFLNAAKNRKMFFIVQDNNGNWYLMGDKLRGAMLAPSDGAVTGTATTDSNQVTSTFTYVSTGAYRYDGDTEEILEVASNG